MLEKSTLYASLVILTSETLALVGSPDNVPAFLEKVKRREAVLSGFGHRVYKTSGALAC